MVSGSIPSKTITVIDQKTETPVWSLTLDLGVRPMAFATNPDGSTKWIFVQLSDFNGFAVVDFATHKEIQRIKNPDLAPGKTAVHYGGNASHGMALTADGKTLVVNSGVNRALYAYSLPDLKVLGSADVGKAPDWATAHAGRQDCLCSECRVELGVGGGDQDHERGHAHSGGRGSEAEHHVGIPVGLCGLIAWP